MLATATVKRVHRCSLATAAMLPLQHQTKRTIHDLTLRKKTGQPMIKHGRGGRSTSNGHIATVFGCTGFLGRYVVSRLAQQGTQVVVAYRDPDETRHLKVTGDLGQIVPLAFDLRDRDQLTECIRHSDIVYNLIGRDYETKNFTFEDVHVKGSRDIASICAEADVARFVQVSALNASEDSTSHFLRTKAQGEKAVREIIPDATIVRPGTMWGHEDRFLNRIGVPGLGWQFWVNGGQTKIRPVSVTDVAAALDVMLTAESTMGKTYELYGPKEYSYEEIYQLVRDITMKALPLRPLPKSIARFGATLMDKLPYDHMISPDLIERMSMDDKFSPDAHTFADLYIDPVTLESVALQYLRRFRSNAVFDMPFEKGQGEVKKGVYHIID